MFHRARRSGVVVGTLIGSLAGCSGGGSAESGREVAGEPDARAAPPQPEAGTGDPTGEPDASADTGTALPPQATLSDLLAACERACNAQAACAGLTEQICMDDCAAQAEGLAGSDCLDEAVAEQACITDLSCDSFRGYVLEGRRQHATCGAAAQAYFGACTLGAGQVPAQCAALCERYAACEAAPFGRAACEERCVLRATEFDASGSACSSAFLTFSGCVAAADCAAVVAFAQTDEAPASCTAELGALEAGCQ